MGLGRLQDWSSGLKLKTLGAAPSRPPTQPCSRTVCTAAPGTAS